MITFLLSIIILVAAYFIYGKYVERLFGADSKRDVPANTMADGVDYRPLPTWKVYIIQFLNIAGLGPIFGAVMGAAYGPMAFLWIVFGCIFMGAVHDYLSGMLSIRNGGKNLNSLIELFLGRDVSILMTIVLAWLLLAVGVSFVSGPAGLMGNLTGWSVHIWFGVIFLYYIIATLLPIDKIIGKIYPFMGAALIFMALSVGIAMVIKGASGGVSMIELTPETMHNYKSNPSLYPLFPMLFVVISCGAISGFHATQSPLMARCIKNEAHGRRVFFGAMITEGIVACIWAAAAMAYFNGPDGLNVAMNGSMNPTDIVTAICNTWLGKVGAVIAIIGVVVCPITSGDTAFRSLRLIVAERFNISQKRIAKRILVSLPIFAVGYLLCKLDFQIIWTYVGIGNQCLAAITLWTISTYLAKAGKPHWITSIPATLLTFVCISYFIVAPNPNGGLQLDYTAGIVSGAADAIVIFALFSYHFRKSCKSLQ